MKFPETVLIAAPAMGEFGKPERQGASISTRRSPTASLTHSSATGSVMRQTLDVVRTRLAALQLRFDLRARSMHEHHAYAGAVQEVDVVRKLDELAFNENLPAEGEYEGLSAKSVEVRCNRAKPADELSVGAGPAWLLSF